MGPIDPRRLLSAPHWVHFAGFRARMPELQQAGWEFAAEQEYTQCGIRLAMRHQGFNLRAITNWVDFDFYMVRAVGMHSLIDFHVIKMSHTLMVERHCNDGSIRSTPGSWSAIDAMPQFSTVRMDSIDDLGIFATPLVRTQEIIIDPNDVGKMMERILELQKPEQAELRKKQRNAARREGLLDGSAPMKQQQQFHAQILSIAA